MFALVDTQARTVLTFSSQPLNDMGGEWGEWLRAGRAVWSALPADTEPDEVLVAVDGSVSVDSVKKATKQAKKAALTDALARIRTYDEDTANSAQQKQWRKDITVAVKYLLGAA